MSEHSEKREAHEDEDVDPGEPIVALADFEQSTSPSFMMRVRRKIQRRTTTAQVASFTWNVPSIVLLELWRILIQLLQLKDVEKGSRT